MERPISSMMTTAVQTVRADDTIEAVADELRRTGLSFVPVVDSPRGKPIGMISADDIVRFQAARRDAATVRAWEICSYKPVEVEVTATVSEVAQLMLERQAHHVVVTDNNEVVGIVSSLDFVKEFARAG
jgi:CBS domain-containing protein